MSAATIDYDALAAQHGGAPQVDYDALAAQHGGSVASSAAPEHSILDPKGGWSPGDLVRGAASGVKNMFAHPLDTMAGMAEPLLASGMSPNGYPTTAATGRPQDSAANAQVQQQAQQGQQQAAQQIQKNPLYAIGGVVGPAAVTYGAAKLAPKLVPAIAQNIASEEGAMGYAGSPGGIPETLKVKLGGPPERMLTSAIKPGKNNLKWTEDIKTANPYMKSAEADLGHPIESVEDALSATAAAKQKIWSQVKAFMGPASEQGARIDGNQIADAIMETVGPRMKQMSPELVQQLTDRANAYRRPMSVDEAENFLSGKDGVNNELTTYYAKNKVSQRVAEGDPQMAATVAEGQALRDALYSKIDQMSGPGVAQMKWAYGALTNVEKELNGRQIVYARQAPVNLPEQLSYIRAAGKIATGNVLGGVKDIAVQRFLSDLNDTNSQIARAFRNSPEAAPFPQPRVRMPQTTNLLPAQSGAKTPLMAPDPGMSGGENIAALMQLLRNRQQLALPAKAMPIQLPPQF